MPWAYSRSPGIGTEAHFFFNPWVHEGRWHTQRHTETCKLRETHTLREKPSSRKRHTLRRARYTHTLRERNLNTESETHIHTLRDTHNLEGETHTLSNTDTKKETHNAEAGTQWDKKLKLQYLGHTWISSVQFSSVTLSCPTLCDPMNRSTPDLSVHHQLPEFTQTHVHRVGDAIQPSHPLSSPSPPAPNPSQHQSLFQWVNSLHEVAKVLEFQL